MTKDLPDSLQLLIDRQEIVNLLHRYCDITDRSTYEGEAIVERLREIFVDDAMVDYGLGTIAASAAEWIAQWKEMRPRLGRIYHQYSNFLIRIEGDKASATHHATARHSWENGDFWSGGAVFHSTHVRTLGGWRIGSIMLEVRYMDDPAGRLATMIPGLTRSFVAHERGADEMPHSRDMPPSAHD